MASNMKYAASDLRKEPANHNYEFVADRSWLPKRCTFERANRVMQRSISQGEHPPGMDYIWVDDLKDQHERVLPSAHRERERTSNSFLQYRVLVQRAFTGKQTDISKEIEGLWRSENKEMQFQCYRNSEIENHLGAKRSAPSIDPSCSAHELVRALSPLPARNFYRQPLSSAPSRRCRRTQRRATVKQDPSLMNETSTADIYNDELSDEEDMRVGFSPVFEEDVPDDIPSLTFSLKQETPPPFDTNFEYHSNFGIVTPLTTLSFGESEQGWPISFEFSDEYQDVLRTYRETIW